LYCVSRDGAMFSSSAQRTQPYARKVRYFGISCESEEALVHFVMGEGKCIGSDAQAFCVVTCLVDLFSPYSTLGILHFLSSLFT
jgi:hypothetical protein